MNEQTSERLVVVGFAARTSNDAERDPERAQIGALWGRVMSGALDAVPRREPAGRIVAVYHDYESDHTGAYSIVVGTTVIGTIMDRANDVPDGMVTVPAARCAVFEARGQMPDALIEKWGEIWNAFEGPATKRAFTTDVELHAPGGSGADLWIAITDA